MSIPAATQILNEFQARLGNITIANGYSFDLKKISRSKVGAFQNGDLPEVDLWSEESEARETTYHVDAYRMPVYVLCVTNKTDKKNLNDIAIQLSSDILIAVNRATTSPLVSDNRSRDLGSIVEKLGNPTSRYLISANLNEDWAAVEMSFPVDYNTPYGDPYTLKVI